MLPPCTDTFLGIGSSFPCRHGGVGIGLTEEDGFELVHTGVGEEECWVVEWSTGRGGDVEVGVGFEVFDEGGTDFVGCPFFIICFCRKGSCGGGGGR